MTQYKEGSKPARQGTYEVLLDNESETVAIWTAVTGSREKVWHHFPAERPDEERAKPLVLEGVIGFRPASDESVHKLKLARTTLAERLENVYKAYLSQHSTSPLYTAPIPARRKLEVGMAIELGMHKDARIVEFRRDGQDVICSYHDVGRKHGVEFDNGTAYRAVHWTEVIPLASNKHTHFARRPVLLDAYRTSMVSSLMHKVQHGVDASPDYQRDYVWTEKDKQNFLESLFEGRELGRFLFVRHEYPKLDDVLDGKQRLGCLCEFFEGRIAYKGVYFDELSRSDRMRIENRSVQFAELPGDRLTRAALLEIFLQVNAAGVPQSEEHLAHVRELLKKELQGDHRMQEAIKTLESFPANVKVADLYDEEEELRDALATCFPDFEYPNFSWLTMREVVRKARAKHPAN